MGRRNTFTDLEAAKEEAHFLRKEDGSTYGLARLDDGLIWVTRKEYAKKMGCGVFWDTAKKSGNINTDARFWTDSHKLMVTDRYGKLGPQVMADKLGRTKSSVVKMAQKLGVKYKRRTEEEWALVVWKRGHSPYRDSGSAGRLA